MVGKSLYLEARGWRNGASPHSSQPSLGTNWIPLIWVEKGPAKGAQVPWVMYGPESGGISLAWAKKPSRPRNPCSHP